jgi:methionine biosynthesis protein MetW
MSDIYIPKVGERVEIASRYVRRCKRLLDVGCGDGVIAHFLKRKVFKIYGIDNSEQNLEKAKKRGVFTVYVDLDKEKIPFKDSYFDVVTCLDVIEHIRNPVNLMKEIYRVLKKGGRLILSAPNIRFSDHLITLVLKGRFPITSEDKTAYDGGHIHYFTFSDLKNISIMVGFRIIREVGIINKPKRVLREKLENLF